MQKLLISLAFIASLITSGCAIYRIDVQQGNVIEQEAVDQLKPGMSKKQVEFLLGTPTLVDPFHLDRWDYLYSYKPGRGKREQTHISLYFTDDKLARIEGDMHPNPNVPADQAEVETTSIVVPPGKEEKPSMMRRAWGWLWPF